MGGIIILRRNFYLPEETSLHSLPLVQVKQQQQLASSLIDARLPQFIIQSIIDQ